MFERDEIHEESQTVNKKRRFFCREMENEVKEGTEPKERD